MIIGNSYHPARLFGVQIKRSVKMIHLNKENIIERFKRYIAIDTKSDPDNSENTPSTAGQLDLARLLADELQSIGLSDVFLDEAHGYVYAKLPANTDKPLPAIAFIAHLDTAPDLDGKCVNPRQFVYRGGDIELNEDYSVAVRDFPFLEDLKGRELITTDGTTLLGADDKAGIAAIVSAFEAILRHRDIKHGPLALCFTPDEEIGHGASLLDLERLGADFAYTVDGGERATMEYENFNAASAVIRIQGRNVHPGSAKNKMIHAGLIGMELFSMLPAAMRPEATDGYEGFFLLTDLRAAVEEATMKFIIRDHSMRLFEEKKALLTKIVAFLNEKYGNRLNLTMEDTYFNMVELFRDKPEVIALCREAMRDLGMEPVVTPIRGGTDGAQLSFRGLPCPNFFTGGYNFHGRYELIPVDSLLDAVRLIIRIAERAAK